MRRSPLEGEPLLSSGQVKPGLDEFLRIVGQMLQDAGKREALKGAAATLVQTAATVGGSLQNRNAKEAVTSGAGLIIEGLGRKAPDRKRNVVNIEQEE